MVIFVLVNSVSYVQQVIIANIKTNESEIYRKLAFTDLMTMLKNRSAYDHFLDTLTEEVINSKMKKILNTLAYCFKIEIRK